MKSTVKGTRRVHILSFLKDNFNGGQSLSSETYDENGTQIQTDYQCVHTSETPFNSLLHEDYTRVMDNYFSK